MGQSRVLSAERAAWHSGAATGSNGLKGRYEVMLTITDQIRPPHALQRIT
jgi:hypothetical protein